MPCFENNLDPEQPASQKPTVKDLCGSLFVSKSIVKPEPMQHIWLKIGEQCSILKYSSGQEQRVDFYIVSFENG